MRSSPASIIPLVSTPMGNAFSIEIDAGDPMTMNLLVSPLGRQTEPDVIWNRRFETDGERSDVLDAIHTTNLDLSFLGRITMIFGTAEFDRIVDEILADAGGRRREVAEKAAAKVRKHQIVELYAPDTKHRYWLELQRKSRDTADWKVSYDRAAERDRLCDWLRWQKKRFLEFLDYAAEHGDEALTRLLTDEMFEIERRVKKEGRGAGGVRPLRMWRGD